MEAALDAYKYRGAVAWRQAFGELLARFLTSRSLLQTFDLLVSSPTYVGPGGRRRDHVGEILVAAGALLPTEAAARVDRAVPAAIVKTGPTPRLAGRGHAERRVIAETMLRPLLHVSAPRRTAGRRILVFDDVFTDGRTLDEVARALRVRGGAREVCGISLCRQPWREAGARRTPTVA